MVSRPFSAFEKESLEIAGRLSRRPGSRSRYEADLRQWHASKMARSRLLVRYSVRLQRRLNSDRKSFEISWVSTMSYHDGEKVALLSPWVELRRLLSESQSSSSERRRTHGTPKMNSWRFFEGSSTSAIVQRQRPAPGQVMLHQQQLEQAASLLLACQWPKIVQPRTGWRHARQQPNFLLLFGTCGDSLSGTTTGDGAAEWIKTIVLSSPFSSTSNRRTALKLGTTDLRGLRNTLVQKKLEIHLRQKSRFWSVHACLNLFPNCQ